MGGLYHYTTPAPKSQESERGQIKYLIAVNGNANPPGHAACLGQTVPTEELKDAQLHPERHKDLLIRVAGYSAFFVELCKESQDDIIDRSEYRF